MNKLLIDTTESKKTKIGLLKGSKKDSIESSNNYKSQETLMLIEKILKKNKLTPKDIEEVEVNVGPGSFTGIKVGIAIANALGFSLKIKINGKKPGEVEAIYF